MALPDELRELQGLCEALTRAGHPDPLVSLQRAVTLLQLVSAAAEEGPDELLDTLRRVACVDDLIVAMAAVYAMDDVYAMGGD